MAFRPGDPPSPHLLVPTLFSVICSLTRHAGDGDGMMPDGQHLTRCGSFTMVTTIVRVTLVLLGTAVYLGLAILGWGGWTAFFAHPARIALAVVLFVLAGVSLVAGGNLSRGLQIGR